MSVVERRAAKKAQLRTLAIKRASVDYTPEMPVPESELRAIGRLVVRLGMSAKPPDLATLKVLILQLQAAFKRAKASAAVDQREFEAAVEGEMWLGGMSTELEKSYAALGYVKQKTPSGYKFRKTVE